MSWVAVAVGGGALVGGVLSSNAQRSAGHEAADAQRDSSAAGIAEQRRQFDAIQKLLAPYVNAGSGALTQQQALIGLAGPAAQRKAIQALQSGQEFQALTKQGETAILQNASATGGLRGGNTQAALAEFRPQMLAQLINDQYSRLGGMTSLGQNAAVGVGNAGMQTGSSIAQLLQQQGAAVAGGALAGGRATAGMWGSVANGIGAFAGLGGFGAPSAGGYGSVTGSDLYGWKGAGGF